MKNLLPDKINKTEFGIINNSSLFEEGSHWVAYLNNPKEEYVEYFDSFGLPPAKEIEKYLLTSNKSILYNSSQIQDNKSLACGYFCLDFIFSRMKGISLFDFIHKFDIINLPINEDLLRKV